MSIPVPFDEPAKYLSTFWLASHDFWQSKWDYFLDTFGEDSFNLRVHGTVIYTFLAYWIIGAVYTFVDLTGKPAFMRRYKIQEGTNEPVDREKLKKVSHHNCDFVHMKNIWNNNNLVILYLIERLL